MTNEPLQWESCPSGEVSRLAQRLKGRRRASALRQTAALGTGLLLLLAVGWFAMPVGQSPPADPSMPDFRFGGIACSEVRPILVDYRHGHLDAELASRVAAHLEQCEPCDRLARQMAQAGESHRQHGFPPTAGLHAGNRFRLVLASR